MLWAMGERNGQVSSPSAHDGPVVLCVDDDPGVLDALELVLTLSGYQVITAQQADDAVAQVVGSATAPAAIITDFQLPDGNGHELIRRLRHTLGQPVPAVLLTADRAQQHDRNGASTGYRVLRKPADADVLLRVLRELLGSAAPSL